MVPVVPVQFPSAGVERTAELPRSSWTRRLTCPCVQRQVPMTQFNKVVDVPVIMRGGSAPDSVHRRLGGHSSSAEVLGSQLGGNGGGEGICVARCCAHQGLWSRQSVLDKVLTCLLFLRQVPFLDKAVVCPLFLRQLRRARTVQTVQKTRIPQRSSLGGS